jgi:hypothetical protein
VEENSKKKPWLLLDVDGVVNLGLFLSSRQRSKLRGDQGWISTRAGDPHDPYAARIVTNRNWGRILLGLTDVFDLAWATGWSREANWYISPLLGLPELPVAPAVVKRDEAPRKAFTVIPWTQGRPWCWLEDIEHELLHASVITRVSTPHCPLLVDRTTGLTEAHAESARKWAEGL